MKSFFIAVAITLMFLPYKLLFTNNSKATFIARDQK